MTLPISSEGKAINTWKERHFQYLVITCTNKLYIVPFFYIDTLKP